MFSRCKIVLGGLAALALTTGVLQAEPQELRDNVLPKPWGAGDALTGNWGGLRLWLERHGIEVFGGWTFDVWGNTRGGRRTGAVYNGLLDFGVNLDLAKSLGWPGASMRTTWLWLSGRDASADLTGNFFTISNLAADPALRLQELWFEQEWLEGAVALRLGQMGADGEFFISEEAALLNNATFGWPAALSLNLPEGGPAYPLGSPAVRLALQPSASFRWLTAVFQGDAFAPADASQAFRWRLNRARGFLGMSEAQWRWNHSEAATGQRGGLRAGAWFHSGSFTDVADERPLWGDYGVYAILDQMVLPLAQEECPHRGLAVFGRSAFAPAQRNILPFYADAGLVFHAPLPSRPDDRAGLAAALGPVSSRASSTAMENAGVNGRGTEVLLEAIYEARVTPWCTLAPDLQCIWNSGGNPASAPAVVVGFRVAMDL